MKFNKKNHHITTKKIFLSVAYLYSLSICSIENTYENAQSTGLSLTQSPTSNFYKLDQKLLFCFVFVLFSFSQPKHMPFEYKRTETVLLDIFLFINFHIFFYYYSKRFKNWKKVAGK